MKTLLHLLLEVPFPLDLFHPISLSEALLVLILTYCMLVHSGMDLKVVWTAYVSMERFSIFQRILHQKKLLLWWKISLVPYKDRMDKIFISMDYLHLLSLV